MSGLALTVEPSELEPATSWISRLAQRNGCSTAQEFALDMGVSWKAIRVGDQSAISRICEIAKVDVGLLKGGTYRAGDSGSKWIADELLASKQMRFDRAKVCATCVTDSFSACKSYLRSGFPVWWSFDGLIVCPIHNELLLELEPTRQGQCNHDLAGRVYDNHSRIITAANSPQRYVAHGLEKYVIQRLSGDAGSRRRWINTLDLSTVIRASEMLGNVVIGSGPRGDMFVGGKELADATAVGFEMLSSGPQHLKIKLEKLLPSRQKGGFIADFFPFSRWLERFQERPGCRPLVKVVRDFAVENHPFEIGDLVFGEAVEAKRVHSISSSASKANVPFPRMRKALGAARERKALTNLPRPNHYLWVRTSEWDPWLEEFGSAIQAKPAAHLMGVCRSTFIEMVSVGFVKPLADVPGMAPRYLAADIAKFIDTVTQGSVEVETLPNDVFALNAAQYSCGVGMIRVIQLLLNGELRSVWRLASKQGLRAIHLSKLEVLDQMEGPPLPGVGSVELRKLLAINYETIPWLEANGFLVSEKAADPRTQKSMRLFRFEVIDRFLNSYETVGRISHRLHKKPPYIVKLLKDKGIEPILVERNMSVFFRREDLPVDFL